MPYINFLVNDGTDESNSSLATSLGFFGNSVAGFIYAYVLAGIGALCGGISSHGAFLYGCIWLIIVLIGVVGYSVSSRKKEMNTK